MDRIRTFTLALACTVIFCGCGWLDWVLGGGGGGGVYSPRILYVSYFLSEDLIEGSLIEGSQILCIRVKIPIS